MSSEALPAGGSTPLRRSDAVEPFDVQVQRSASVPDWMPAQRGGAPEGSGTGAAGPSQGLLAEQLTRDDSMRPASKGMIPVHVVNQREADRRRTAFKRRESARAPAREGLAKVGRQLATPAVESAVDGSQRTDDKAADASALIERYKGPLGLDEARLGEALAQLALSDPAGNRNLIQNVYEQLKSKKWFSGGSNKGQVATHMLQALSDADLKKLNSSREGEAVLKDAERTMRLQGISFEEAKQIVRLSTPSRRVPTAGEIQQIQSLIDVGRKQDAIDAAIKAYGIDTRFVKGTPTYEKAERDYASTSFEGEVSVGSRAIQSAAVLGSTLAHECEVHGKQVHDKALYLTKRGQALNQIEAFDYEITNAQRFGLSEADLKDIVAARRREYRRLDDETKSRADNQDYRIPGELTYY